MTASAKVLITARGEGSSTDVQIVAHVGRDSKACLHPGLKDRECTDVNLTFIGDGLSARRAKNSISTIKRDRQIISLLAGVVHVYVHIRFLRGQLGGHITNMVHNILIQIQIYFLYGGGAGIRTLGAFNTQRFSRPPLSAAQPPLRRRREIYAIRAALLSVFVSNSTFVFIHKN